MGEGLVYVRTLKRPSSPISFAPMDFPFSGVARRPPSLAQEEGAQVPAALRWVGCSDTNPSELDRACRGCDRHLMPLVTDFPILFCQNYI